MWYYTYMERLKELRKKAKLTQQEVADMFSVSRKTYQKYESHPELVKPKIYEMYCDQLEALTKVDEEHGLLTVDMIKDSVKNIFEKYKVRSCILFGSYARGEASESSDVDMVIDCDISGLDFFGLIEEIREVLHKKVDLLDVRQLINNKELISEIMKDGIRVYG